MNWYKCSKEAYEKCPDRLNCDPFGKADYGAGSECDIFNQKIEREAAMERGLDLVNVVRCKECKHFDGNDACYSHAADENGIPIFVREHDFCSYGERRATDEENQ